MIFLSHRCPSPSPHLHLLGLAGLTDITLTERQVDTHGDAGWFHARYVFAAVPAEPAAEPVRDEGYVSMLWIRQEDGSYRMPLFHASPLPEAPPEEMAE